MRLMATLRRIARLRAAVRSRTRLSSSRKVTSRTQWSPFSMVQCRRIAWIRTAGHYDFALYGKIKMTPWDHAPGVLIHQEAGRYAACLDGRPYTVRQRSGGLFRAPPEESWRLLREALVGDLDKGSQQGRL